MEDISTYENVLKDSQEHTFTFSYKSVCDHLIEILKSSIRQIPKAITMFITIWAIAEIFLLDDKSNLNDILLPTICLSVIVSFYNGLKNYRNTIPLLLRNESETTQKIFFYQRLGWQYALSKEMIENGISESKFALIRIRQNAEYITPNKLMDGEFIEFAKNQPEKVLRLVSAVKIACINYLPNALSIMKQGKDDELTILKKEVDNLIKLYAIAVDYERSIYQVVPSNEFTEVHEYMKGWTDPIRDGIRQFISLLDKLSKIKKSDFKNMKGIVSEYKIVFEEPENIKLFNKAIDSIMN